MSKEKMTVSVGVQTFGLAQELSQGFDGTFERLKVMGFDSVEPFICTVEQQGKFPANLWSYEYLDRGIASAKKYGLSIHSAHIGMSFGPVRLPISNIAAGIRRIVKRSDIRYFVVSGMFSDDKGAKSWGKTMRKLSEALADTDAVLVYHNHDVELIPIFSGGRMRYPLETFFAFAGESVKLQLDIGWAAMASDECRVLETFQDRIVSIHCKDFYPDARDPKLKRGQIKPEQFAPIGCGFVQTAQILREAIRVPGFSGDIIIDQDKCGTDRMEELRIGHENITQFLNGPQVRYDRAETPPVIHRERLSLMTFSLMGDVMSRKMTVCDTLKLAADAGIPFVDVMMVPEKQVGAYRTAMAETGVKVKCYIANIDFFAPQEKIQKQLSSYMDIADKLSAEFFMIVPYLWPWQFKTAAKMEKADVRSKLIQGFQSAVSEGRKRGLRVCFETTPHPELYLSASEDCQYILDRVDGLEYVFDTANMLPAGETPEQHYQRTSARISHVHLKDVLLTKSKHAMGEELTADGWKMNCCLWGHGVIPVGKIYTQMIQDGYTGTFAIEYAHPSGIGDFKTHTAQLAAHFERFT